MKKILLSLSVALAAVLPSQAQSDDFGVWASAGIDKSFGKKLSVEADVETRLEDNASRFTRKGFGVSATYKPWKFLRFGVGYRFMNDWYAAETSPNYTAALDPATGETVTALTGYNADSDFRRNKHRLYVQATGRVKVGRFTLSLRERLQYTHFRPKDIQRTRYRALEELTEYYPLSAEYIEDFGTDGTYMYDGQYFLALSDADPVAYTYTDAAGNAHYFTKQPYYSAADDTYYNGVPTEYAGSTMAMATGTKHKSTKNRYYVRSRFQASYNVKGLPLEPYAAVEMSNSLHEGFAAKKWRFALGADYTIKKTHQIGLAYVFNHGTDDDNEGDLHALSLSYTFKF